MLKKHDLFFYPEGGRSYSGELKPAKTGLIHAALTAGRPDLVIIPTAIAYDLVLEDHILARQRVKKRQRPFARELAEMVRYAVGYRSRAFVTFGAPIPAGDCDAAVAQRRARADAPGPRAHRRARTRCCRRRVFAAAMRPSITRRDLEARIDRLIEELAARRANLGVTSGRQAIDEAAEPLETRGIIVARARPVPRPRTQRAPLLRADDRAPAGRPPAARTDARQRVEGLLPPARAQRSPEERWRRAYGMRKPTSFARRFIAGETIDEAIAAARAARSARAHCTRSIISARASRRLAEADAATRDYLRVIGAVVASGIEPQPLAEADAARPRRRSRQRRRQPAQDPRPRRTGGFFVRIDMESSRYTEVTLEIFETLWQQGYRQHRRRAAGGAVSHRAGPRAHQRARRAHPAGQGRVPRAEGGRVPARRPTSTPPTRG